MSMIERVAALPRRFFHVSRTNLQAGQVLQPGQFGKQWSSINYEMVVNREIAFTVDVAKTLMFEIALETARLAVAPTRISRFSCVFATENMADAIKFRNGFRQNANIYEVEELSPGADLHRADFALLTPDMGFGARPFADYMIAQAMSYWKAEPSGMIEILYGGELRVLREVW